MIFHVYFAPILILTCDAMLLWFLQPDHSIRNVSKHIIRHKDHEFISKNNEFMINCANFGPFGSHFEFWAWGGSQLFPIWLQFFQYIFGVIEKLFGGRPLDISKKSLFWDTYNVHVYSEIITEDLTWPA